MDQPEPASFEEPARRPFGPTVPVVRIENNTGAGFKTQVFIDGVDVSYACTGVTVHAPLKDAVTADVTMLVSELAIDNINWQPALDHTREALIKAGWTPPPDDTSTAEPTDDQLTGDEFIAKYSTPELTVEYPRGM